MTTLDCPIEQQFRHIMNNSLQSILIVIHRSISHTKCDSSIARYSIEFGLTESSTSDTLSNFTNFFSVLTQIRDRPLIQCRCFRPPSTCYCLNVHWKHEDHTFSRPVRSGMEWIRGLCFCILFHFMWSVKEMCGNILGNFGVFLCVPSTLSCLAFAFIQFLFCFI